MARPRDGQVVIGAWCQRELHDLLTITARRQHRRLSDQVRRYIIEGLSRDGVEYVPPVRGAE